VKRPPGLAAKTVAVTFVTVAIILSIVFIVLIVDARDRMRAAETAKLEASARIFDAFEARRDRDQLATTATLAENPTLKAAFDTYTTESRLASSYEQRLEAQQTVTRELEKLAAVTSASVLAILDAESRVFASAGIARQRWPANSASPAFHCGSTIARSARWCSAPVSTMPTPGSSLTSRARAL
jgi:hypothetical protein